MVSAGHCHTVLLRSDGNVVAIGDSGHGQCEIPALEEGTTYTQTWIVFMLGLCLCNVAFGISGMALSAMLGPAHVCSFAMCIFGFALFFHPFDLGLITGGSPVLCSGLLGPVAWVMALTCLVPVHVRCSFGGSSHKSFTRTSRFLQQCSYSASPE